MVSSVEATLAAHRPRIAHCLRRLDDRLQRFSEMVAHGGGAGLFGGVSAGPVVVYRPVWGEHDGRDVVEDYRAVAVRRALDTAVQALCAIEYEEAAQRVNRSVRFLGALGAGEVLHEQAVRINLAKRDLQSAMAPLSGRMARVAADGHGAAGPEVAYRQLASIVLSQLQRPRVNLLAAYRALPIISEEVDEIRFVTVRTRSVPRATVAEVRARIGNEPSAAAREDLERLSALPPDEYLVAPKAYYDRIRAHVYLRRLGSGARRAMRVCCAELPVLFPMTARRLEPTIRAPAPPRATRGSPPSRIEPAAIVESLGYYRMREPFRVRAGSG